ncbi:Maf family nucleotide pyrophosphatase [Mesonia aestuariivivens]|uniref:dTTP/UTP pyrophosphatase n=1 Tax=Mesonia aestuariivivens TaxID=2796128 RepID=A0ABS6VYH1_9FLAO|nr:Maf family nucleotide pyrophosphatase [Mesonia aestuariivivens]MBW2960648.1 Maf family nucleotide pyrophosphatase [Mesonia aestuariivivens]
MLKEKLSQRKISLASGSPRRQQFLKDLGLDFEIRLKPVEEVYSDSLRGAEIATFLAELKAQAFENSLADNEILITGDTIVCINDQALGKPKDEAEANEMLLQLSGKTHEVISSVCLKSNQKTKTFYDKTVVYFKSLSNEEINFYINNHQPFDKAGAYGIQEWIGQIGVEKIEGSYFTVMGMPTHLLYTELLKF